MSSINPQCAESTYYLGELPSSEPAALGQARYEPATGAAALERRRPSRTVDRPIREHGRGRRQAVTAVGARSAKHRVLVDGTGIHVRAFHLGEEPTIVALAQRAAVAETSLDRTRGSRGGAAPRRAAARRSPGSTARSTCAATRGSSAGPPRGHAAGGRAARRISPTNTSGATFRHLRRAITAVIAAACQESDEAPHHHHIPHLRLSPHHERCRRAYTQLGTVGTMTRMVATRPLVSTPRQPRCSSMRPAVA